MSLRTANQVLGNRFSLKPLLVLLLTLLMMPPAFALEKVISGQVRDDKNAMMSGVKVDLWTTDGAVSMSTRTDGEGKFSFTHEKCGPCFLEVFAPRKSNLASALVDEIPGDEGRSVIVTLKKGYLVNGRVMCAGKGVKGVVVKAYSRDHAKNKKERVYGGGATTTDRNGWFEMTLTPGEKKFVILNSKHPKIAKNASIVARIITETELGEIELPER